MNSNNAACSITPFWSFLATTVRRVFLAVKPNLLNFGTQVPLLIHWPVGISNPGRRIDNPTSLVDLAPTYLEAAGLPPHEGMNGRSVLPILREANAAGVSELGNNFVITGRERHFGSARAGSLPYPSRAIRTKDYLYIRNFKPDRWPMMTPPLSDGERTHGDFRRRSHEALVR